MSFIHVTSAAAVSRIAGPGWSLRLAQGWHLADGPRAGDARAVGP